MTANGVPPDAEPDKKMAVFSAKLSENTAKEITINVPHLIGKEFVADGKMDFNKEHEQFVKDLNRDMKVFIETRKTGLNGKVEFVTHEAPKDFETARDMIVRFITGDQDEVDTFETASDSVKKQTCLLMSILNQYTSTAVMTGFMKAVQKEGTGMATTEDSNLCKAGTGMNFTLNRTADGDIQISFEQDVGISCVIITGDTYPYFLDYDRSCCHIGAEIKLTAESLETVANRDWTKLDYEAIKAEGQKCNTEGQLDLIAFWRKFGYNRSCENQS